VVRGDGVDPAAIEKAIAQADRLCPVLAMLKPGTTVTTAFRMEAGSPVEENAPAEGHGAA